MGKLTKHEETTYQDITNIAFGAFAALFCVTALATLVLINHKPTSAEDIKTTTSAKASVNVAEACTLSGGDDDFSGEISNNDSKEFGPSRIKASCNDANGLALYAIGYSGDSYTGDTHTDLINSTGSHNIPTGTGSSSSNWGFKLSAVSGDYTPIISGSNDDETKQTGDTDYSDYAAVPSEFKKVAYRTSATDTGENATGAELDAYYRVYIDPSQPAGNYTGKIKYILVHPVTAATPTTKLYMQNFTISECEAKASKNDLTLVDKRDEEEYTVRYFSDTCWMTQNLRFAGSTLDSSTSNIDKSYTQDTPLVISWGDLASGNSFDEAQLHAPTLLDIDEDGTRPLDMYSSKQIGNWYNYCGASAGTICENGGDAVYDICPAGWRLPSYDDAEAVSGDIANASTLSFIFGGSWFKGDLMDVNDWGQWWTSKMNINRHFTLEYDIDNKGNYSLSVARDRDDSGSYLRCVLNAER